MEARDDSSGFAMSGKANSRGRKIEMTDVRGDKEVSPKMRRYVGVGIVIK